MKNNSVRTVAEWVLIASVVLSVVFFVQFSNRSRTLRKLNTSLQKEVSTYQNTQTILNMLVTDTLEYSKQHPDINPILEAVGAKPAHNAPAKLAGK